MKANFGSRAVLVGLFVAFVFGGSGSPALAQIVSKSSQRTLTFAERVAYQRAIEEVYWHHRIWPKERPDPKPSLDAVMSQGELKKKVAEYLWNSQALEDYWHRPINAEQLQAEMERMAQHTKQPEVLQELFEALRNDPFVIAECLARPVLADRTLATVAPLKKSSVAKPETQLPKALAAMSANYALPVMANPSGGCIDDSWTTTSTTNVPSERDQQTVVWTGSEMIVWGGLSSNGSGYQFLSTGGRYNPATDSWTAVNTINAPSGRYRHTAVWTGSEMIIWGGYNNVTPFQTGGRYNPATDSWTATNTINAPAGRFWHTAVWNGNEMIVWGGATAGGNYLNTGGIYNSNTDSWTPTSTTNAPSGRVIHTAVWTGGQMIVWGGYNNVSGNLSTGGRYNPGTGSWTATSTINAPTARQYHTAVWSGSEMIVWGGRDISLTALNTGGRYYPGMDSWVSTCTTNAPSARDLHTAVWRANEMIIWGGVGAGSANYLNTGGRYDPDTDTWIFTNTDSAPSGRYFQTAVWTGSEMIVWGGFDNSHVFVNSGGRYCAQTAPMAQSAFSRKTHGAAGTFAVPLPLTCNLGIECRSGGVANDYQVVINFMTTVTVGSASVTTGTGTVSSFSVSGSQVIVNLTGVSSAQRITVTLFDVNDGTRRGNVAVSMGVLVGDVNGDGSVNASDLALTKSRSGQPIDATNFRSDINANGAIDTADVSLVKSNVGTGLP